LVNETIGHAAGMMWESSSVASHSQVHMLSHEERRPPAKAGSVKTDESTSQAVRVMPALQRKLVLLAAKFLLSLRWRYDGG